MTRVSVLNDCLNNIVFPCTLTIAYIRTMPKRQVNDKCWFDHQVKSSLNSFKSCKSTVFPLLLASGFITGYFVSFSVMFYLLMARKITFETILHACLFHMRPAFTFSKHLYLLIYNIYWWFFRLYRRIWRDRWSSFGQDCHPIERSSQ